jgi:hypothetical protein
VSTVEVSRERHTWCCHRCGFRWSAAVEIRRVGGLDFCWEHGLPAAPPLASRRCPRCDGLRVDEHLEAEPPAHVQPQGTPPSRRANAAVPWWIGVIQLFITRPVVPPDEGGWSWPDDGSPCQSR